jgi:hypothetical protein
MSIWSYGGGGIWVEALTKSSLEKHVQSLQIKYSGFMNLIYSFILKVEMVEVFDWIILCWNGPSATSNRSPGVQFHIALPLLMRL